VAGHPPGPGPRARDIIELLEDEPEDGEGTDRFAIPWVVLIVER